MAAAGTSEHLMAVIDEQIVCAESMLETLETESEALLQGDADRINDASAGKARLADTLEQLETERQGLAEALALTQPTVTGTATGEKWERLLRVLEQCRDRNARNGSLVQARRTQIEAALKALAPDQPGGYDAAGNKHSTAASHRLGSA
jgi:flagellar biosynthesis/type III secretory pathway chaperone